MSKKFFLCILLMTLLFMLIPGCGESEPVKETSSDSAVETSDSPADQTVEYTVAGTYVTPSGILVLTPTGEFHMQAGEGDEAVDETGTYEVFENSIELRNYHLILYLRIEGNTLVGTTGETEVVFTKSD